MYKILTFIFVINTVVDYYKTFFFMYEDLSNFSYDCDQLN